MSVGGALSGQLLVAGQSSGCARQRCAGVKGGQQGMARSGVEAGPLPLLGGSHSSAQRSLGDADSPAAQVLGVQQGPI